jgi:hypothetical protein
MIPESQGNSYAPFIKCAELNKGLVVMIKTEFAPPENPKIQSPIIGNVLMEDGSEYTLGLNWSTLRGLQKVYGVDTKNWIGKKIEFFGMKKLGKGNGYLWGACD